MHAPICITLPFFFCHYFARALLCRNAGRTNYFAWYVEIQGNEKKSVIGKGTVLQAALEKWLRLKFAYDRVFLLYAYTDNAS